MMNGTMNIKSYTIDRFSRIYPPLLMAILFYFITSIMIPETPFSWSTALGNLLNLQGICCRSLVSPFWSLAYEVWFYIALGSLAFALMPNNNYKKIIGFSVFVASVSVFVLGLKMHYFFIWLMGAIAYLVRPSKQNHIVLVSSFIGFFLLCVLWQFSKDTRSFEMAIRSINKEFLELTMSFVSCLFIQQVILFEPKNKVSILIEKYIGRLANFSYTLYLSHRIVFLWIIAYIWPKDSCDFTFYGIVKYVVILFLTLIVCWLIYLISEKQSPKIKSLLKTRILKVSKI